MPETRPLREEIGRRWAIGLLIALGLAAVQTLFPLLQVGLITNDDLKLRNAIQDNGLLGAVHVLWGFTRRHGRLDIAQMLSWYLPLAVDDFVYLKVVSLAGIAADLGLFALFARRVFRCDAAFFLALLLSLVSLQNSWENTPLVAFPGLFTFSFAYLLGSFLAFPGSAEDGRRGWSSAALFLLAVCSYELYLIYLPVFFLLAVQAGAAPRRALRSMVPQLAATVVYLALYLTSRSLRIGNYPGVMVDSDLSLGSLAGAIWQFSVSGLPGYFFLHPKYDFLIHSQLKASGLDGLLATLTAGSVIKALLVGACYLVTMTRSAAAGISRKQVVASLAVAVAYFFAAPLLPALTERGQEEALNQLGLPATYFATFAWILGAVSLLLLAPGSGWRRAVAVTSGGILLIWASLVVDHTNAALAEVQGRAHDRFAVIDAFLASADYASLPAGTCFYAPSLWRTEGTVSFTGTAIDPLPSGEARYENFWTFRFWQRARKKVLVTDRLERIPPDAPGFIYLKLLQPVAANRQYLLFAWINQDQTARASGQMLTNQVSVYDRSALASRTVGGMVVPRRGSPVSVRVLGGRPEQTSAYFQLEVGTRHTKLGDLERFAVVADEPALDVDTVFVAASVPREQRVIKSSGWLPDGWIGSEAKATLHAREPARLVVSAFVPDYVFRRTRTEALTVTLELDGAEVARERLTRGASFRLRANVAPDAPNSLVIRCGPTHRPTAAGVSLGDDRDLCMVVESLLLRKREPGE